MRILSGIQPSGKVHLGNVIGALQQYVAQQELGESFYFVADLHALTVLPDPDELRRLTLQTAATLLAAGVDPERSTVFVQSHVASEHAQLAWILQCVARMGELGRMTQFKEKGEGRGDGVSVGLFTYPVLQAADIVAYDADCVPIGADQKQHVELVRNLAQRCNHRYGAEVLRVPEPLIKQVGGRVMDLQDPTRKMSSSASSDKGVVWVLDEPAAIVKKLRSAVTDSDSVVRFDPVTKPGVSNLLELLHVASGRSIPDLEAEFADGGYGAFKTATGEAIAELLRPMRERYVAYMDDPAELERLLAAGADRARPVAAATLARVVDAVGVGPRTMP